MSIIDTSLLIDRVAEGVAVGENVSIISVIEYPMILEYKDFYGKIFYPDADDFKLALELQSKLRRIGRMKSAADLIIAATCINNKEKLITKDSDFDDISEMSSLDIK